MPCRLRACTPLAGRSWKQLVGHIEFVFQKHREDTNTEKTGKWAGLRNLKAHLQSLINLDLA